MKMLSRHICRRLLSRRVMSAPLVGRPHALVATKLQSYLNVRTHSVAHFSDNAQKPIDMPPNAEVKEEVEEDEVDHEYEDALVRDEIATLALTKYVPLYGWTEVALDKAIEELKYSTAMIGLFPNGASDLVQHFVVKSNTDLIEELEQYVEQEKPRTTQLIRHAIELRLRKNIPYLPHLAQAMALSVRPQAIQDSFQHLAWLVDDIWHMANDKSTDLNWYSKRFMLASVYTATELYMITDRSHDYANTWAFLDRRLNDLKTIMAAPHQSQELINTVCSTASGVLQGLCGLFAQGAAQPQNQAAQVASVLRDVASNVASGVAQRVPGAATPVQGLTQAVAGLSDALGGAVNAAREQLAQAPGNPLGAVASTLGSAAESLAQTPLGSVAKSMGDAAQAIATNGVRPEHVAEIVTGTVNTVVNVMQGTVGAAAPAPAAAQATVKVHVVQVEVTAEPPVEAAHQPGETVVDVHVDPKA